MFKEEASFKVRYLEELVKLMDPRKPGDFGEL